MAIATIRITLETLDSAGKPTNEPLFQEVSDPSGLTFVITETNCDLVGNTTATTIEAYGQGDSKTTLLKYGPDDRSGKPQIAMQGNRIVIEIESVLDISLQENRYKTYAVDYKIKHVEYPQK